MVKCINSFGHVRPFLILKIFKVLLLQVRHFNQICSTLESKNVLIKVSNLSSSHPVFHTTYDSCRQLRCHLLVKIAILRRTCKSPLSHQNNVLLMCCCSAQSLRFQHPVVSRSLLNKTTYYKYIKHLFND